ncbi:MAG: hypothetical protein ACYDD8_26240 [Bradyrhizobium sp.]
MDLASLETAVRQGEPLQALPVYVTVSCGRPSLPVGDTNFNLATWQVLVRLKLENAIVKHGSRRWVQIQKGAFQSRTSSKTTLRTIKEHAIELGAKAQAKASPTVPNIDGSIFARLKWRRRKNLDETNTATTKATSEIILIGQFGEAIAIGDPEYGDPHKEHGLLSHIYPKEVGDDSEPLFLLEPEDPNEPMRVTVMTTVPFDKLCLLSGNANDRLSQLARAEIGRRGEETVEAHEKLRQQMMRDVLAERVSRNQRKAGLPIREGEFAVMIEMFEIRPRVEGGAVGADVH